MNDNTDLHLYIAPKGARLTDAALTYLGAHSAERYPRRLEAFCKLFRVWVQGMVKNAPKDSYKYSMKHYTVLSTGRYSLEEQFEVSGSKDGLCICVGPSNTEERQVISLASMKETEIRSIDGIITYLEDIYENDNQRYLGKAENGLSNLDLLKGLIDLLKDTRGTVGALEFELNAKEDSIELEMVLVSPKVIGYYVGITWVIR